MSPYRVSLWGHGITGPAECASAHDPFLDCARRSRSAQILLPPVPPQRSPRALRVLWLKEAEQNVRHAGGGVYLRLLPPWGSHNCVPTCPYTPSLPEELAGTEFPYLAAERMHQKKRGKNPVLQPGPPLNSLPR